MDHVWDALAPDARTGGGRGLSHRKRCANPAWPPPSRRTERAFSKSVVDRKNWLFYGTNTHAEAAAAIFRIIATCRLHGIDPFVYFDEVVRVLPQWPHDRYLQLAPQHWTATRARIDSSELERPQSHVTSPSPAAASTESSMQAG